MKACLPNSLLQYYRSINVKITTTFYINRPENKATYCWKLYKSTDDSKVAGTYYLMIRYCKEILRTYFIFAYLQVFDYGWTIRIVCRSAEKYSRMYNLQKSVSNI